MGVLDKLGNTEPAREIDLKLNESHEKEWYLCATDFWYWAQFVRTDDEDSGKVKYLPTNCDQLKRTKWEMDNNRLILILKARRQMLSWLCMLRELHASIFCGTAMPDSFDAFRNGTMTIGEVEAKYLIERITKVWHRLPEWMKKKNLLATDNQLLMQFTGGGTIQAFPMKREGPQTFGFSSVVFDEMALQEAARSTWVGMMPTLGSHGRLCAVTTPNGKLNFFFRVWENKGNQFKNIKRIYIHWDGTHRTYEGGQIVDTFTPKNPLHDKKWFDQVTSGMDKHQIARMFFGSFAAYAGMPVWTNFDYDTHVKSDVEVIPNRLIMPCWDFGFHFPALTIWQRNTRDQWVGLSEYEDFDIGFDRFCKDGRDHANSVYSREKFPEIHFVDPAGFQRYSSKAVSGATCDVMEIKAQWGTGTKIRPGSVEVGTRDNEGPRLKEVRKLWDLRADGQPGIIISDKMASFIEGCQGGYCYPEKGGETPDKNEACVPMWAEALTPNGWKSVHELTVGDDIFIYNQEKNKLNTGKLLDIHIYPERKKTIILSSSRTRFTTTPNHRNLIRTKSDVYHWVETKNLKQGHQLLHPVPEERPRKQRHYSDAFITLCAYITAEGWYNKSRDMVYFCESTKCNPKYVKYLLELFVHDPCIKALKQRQEIQTWTVSKERAAQVRQLMPNKYPTAEFITRMNNSNRRRFIYEFFRGDGCFSNGSGETFAPDPNNMTRKRDLLIGKNCIRAVQKNKKTIDAVEMMAALAGINTTVHPKGEYWSITLNRSANTSDVQYLEKQDDYTVGVWCPTTSNGTWLCRQGGKVWITGNSHLQDTIQYGVTGYNRMSGIRGKKKEEKKPERIGRRFGI